jgi:glycosyltransferase involved in cell wall biosynthesis
VPARRLRARPDEARLGVDEAAGDAAPPPEGSRRSEHVQLDPVRRQGRRGRRARGDGRAREGEEDEQCGGAAAHTVSVGIFRAVLEHLIVHQFDPAEHIPGGVHGFIVDLVRFAPDGHRFRLIGVDAVGGRRLGAWTTESLAGREVAFLPLARLSAAAPRRIPHTARLVAGLFPRRLGVHPAFVHAHRVETGLALSVRLPRTRLVQFVHTDAAELVRHRQESLWRHLPQAQLAAERLAVRRAAAAWAFSAEAARRLGVRPGRNWYDDTVFRPVPRSGGGSLTVGWIGRLEPSKDPLRALAALGELPDARGWLAGSGSLEPAVRRQLPANVELRGTLQPAELAAALAETDVLLVSSLWEGQPRAVLEALGSGVPVVSTRVGDVPALVRDGVSGFIAQHGTPGELAALVRRAAPLRGGAEVAASVADHRASVVVPDLFRELELLRG